VLYKILYKYGLNAGQLLYIGSSFSDIDCMKLSEISVCPVDAPQTVKRIADYYVDVISGEGVLSYIYESILKK
jgi:3-deoxy-D-manno-octulosonate 8-phosphate phosphatase KdsC-like HAD superfamily phosphatase